MVRPDWPRADLNLACYEFLIGLTYLACPPVDVASCSKPPDAAALRAAMARLAPAFNLVGEGPLFLQDFAALEGDPAPPDMLFIDSAGESTAKKNADLMVKRKRYPVLPLPLAAIALYTLQAFAPSGGAGNRTSMRGGGPMVTLLKPRDLGGLWSMVWANVPIGTPLPSPETLPWMRSTRTSEKGQVVTPSRSPGDAPEGEVFFGQPRRLRLVVNENTVTGIVQRPYGTNYAGWVHPLSPYYLDTKGQMLPLHPKPGSFGYRNWRGVILQSNTGVRAANLAAHIQRRDRAPVDLVVAGWAMDNMKPLDFLWSEQPVFELSNEAEFAAMDMIEAAEHVAYVLAAAVRDGRSEGEIKGGTADAARLSFFDKTQGAFMARLSALSAGADPDPKGWLREMRAASISVFDAQVLPGLADLQPSRRQAAVSARKSLVNAFGGYGAMAKKIYAALDLELPPHSKKKKDTA